MKRLSKFIAISLVSITLNINNVNATGLPVFDFSSFTQMIIDTSNTIKEMMMFEKQLKEMGIDKIVNIFEDLQKIWDDMNKLSTQMQEMDFKALESLIKQTTDECKQYESMSENFKKLLEDTKKTLKQNYNKDEENLYKQACFEVISNPQALDDINKKEFIEAQQALADNKVDEYKRKMDAIKDRQAKLKNDSFAKQRQVIINMNKEYDSYMKAYKDPKSEQNKAFNQLRKDVQNAKNKDEKSKSTMSLQLQMQIIEILEKQYKMQQETSQMLTTLLGQSIRLNEEVKTQQQLREEDAKLKLENDWITTNQNDFKKDPLGFPDFIQKPKGNAGGGGGLFGQ